MTKLKRMILIALFASIIGIMAQLIIPIPFIPITGQTLAIGITATILGSKDGALATLLYLLIGAIGLPVFAGFSSGVPVLIGPTGGYLVGFLPTAFFIGLMIEKIAFTVKIAFIANLIGMIITLVFGTVWLKIAGQYSWTTAFTSGAAPFIPVGIVKAFLAAWAGIVIRERLLSARVISD
ncbi:biotin transporter BioY [Bacillaceae bacterium Marseille-Q3522]|nr:biotin transporter BioY [Bacillaceae bacterium Marseille-Q3522]